ncbi:hypothetical protein AB0I28_30470 [Phytomonospora sp. NPDC050363]|uniref:hypothetical protein n=1 Tax=Phytomonospora sp. NPDC050363 TaxID=3155642 RepID=UPI0033E431A5
MSDEAIVGVLVDCMIESVRFFDRADGVMDPDLALTALEGIAAQLNESLTDGRRRELADLIRARAATRDDPLERDWVEGVPRHLGLDRDYHSPD